jgi:acyl-CoA synthetase (AMP-forming)/AMP-acid ligase II
VLARTAAVAKDFPYRATTLATTFPATSRPFFARAIATLLNAGAIIDSKDVSAFTRLGANLVCGSPQQAAKLLSGASFRPRIARVEISGAKLPDDVALSLIENFDEVVDVYGATETNKTFESVLTKADRGRLIRTGHKLDSEIEIVSSSGKVCGLGEPGFVRVRNDYTVNGYIAAPEATAKCFREGWFYPGDIAMWGETGEILVIGRDDDVINIGGYKLNAGMIDMVFSSVPGIREAISFENPKPNALDKVLVLAVFEDDAARTDVIEAACEFANARLRLSIGANSIRPVNAIPRTEEGNPDRAACRSMVMQRAGI